MSKDKEIQDLLKPRIKIVAGWPEMEDDGYEVGQIITGEEKDLNVEMINKFPHLFRKLQWWEERNIDDLPVFLRYSRYDGEAVYQVLYYSPSEDPFIAYIKGATSQKNQLNFALKDTQPATEEEYNSHISKLNQ